jgi:hypothetical protein
MAQATRSTGRRNLRRGRACLSPSSQRLPRPSRAVAGLRSLAVIEARGLNLRVDTALPVVIGMAGLAICLYGFYPGYMSFDSAYQYWQMRTLQFTTQHPPSMGFLWLATDAIVEGPAGLLALHLLLYWGSLLLISLTAFGSLAARVAFLLVVGFWPPHLVLLPHIWKDVAMMVSFLASFACLLRHQATGRRRWLFGMFAATLYAVTVRHNAAPAAVPFFWYIGSALSAGQRMPAVRSGVIAAAGLMAAALVVAGINALPIVRVQTVWPTLALWDMSRVSAKEDVLLLPPFAIGPGTTLERVKDGDNHWDNASTFANVGIRTGLSNPYTPEQYEQLRKTWIDMVVSYPRSYLEHRWEMAKVLYGVEYEEATEAGRFNVGIVPFRDNPPMELEQSGLSKLLVRFLRNDLRRVHHAGWVYLILSLAGGAIAAANWAQLRARPSLVLYTSALLYTLPLPLVAPSSAARFNSWLICGSVVATWLLISELSATKSNVHATGAGRARALLAPR